jgi:alanyl-tRNA synthetase
MEPSVIRQQFLDFFAARGHQIVPSAPLVIKNDPTLMFTNAGMNQFKDYFLGNEIPTSRRIADTQKCLRVSGKHNDLEEVGIDTYHHTMFEMLGNWSFGDYFKQEAIAWAWELLTEVYQLPKERIYVTVFAGDPKEGLDPDTESASIWEPLVGKERILYCSKKDNFWEMGDTGPCGPCSELHIDLRSEAERNASSGIDLVNNDHPQVIEIWNLVFIQFNRKADGSLENLPDKHVDTGMGFERLCRAIELKNSNYDTGVFRPLIQKVSELSGVPYGHSEQTDIAMRVVADHVRAVSFAIADGQLPSNNKAGYVIRRILRRAIRYGYQFLGLRAPFMHQITLVLCKQFDPVFPELGQQQSFVSKVIQEEEVSFLRTLDQGLKRLEQTLVQEKKVSGKAAFELYDTYGFPFDLTSLIARENHLPVDEQGFEQELEKQKERSRAAASVDKSDWQIIRQADKTDFIGYDEEEAEVQICRIRISTLKKEKLYELVLDRTPFYAESGGQVGDTGWLENIHERIQVRNTVKENDLIIHQVDRLPEFSDKSFRAVIDRERRHCIMANHSATHLLHAALRRVLGDHVSQKGSLVAPDGLRFDFSHFSKMSDAELLQVEDLVNEQIRRNISKGEERKMPIEQAKALGAMALFGEKYGNEVRVITFDPAYSIELCGGTHVSQTGMIGWFKLVSETAVAAGVRRVEALTGAQAIRYQRDQEQMLGTLKELLRNPADPERSLRQLIDENAQLRKAAEQARAEALSAVRSKLESQIKLQNGLHTLVAELKDTGADELKQLSFELRQKFDNLILILGSAFDGKAYLSVILSDHLVQERKLNAVDLVRQLGKTIEGGGGGQAFFATAGGKKPEGIPDALRQAEAYLAQII